MYNLDITISSALDPEIEKLWSSKSRQTFPFLLPGSRVVGKALRAKDVIERCHVESVVAARNGCFYQTGTFAPFRHPTDKHPPYVSQSQTRIYWQKHNSQHRTMIHNVNHAIQDGSTGERLIVMPWDEYEAAT